MTPIGNVAQSPGCSQETCLPELLQRQAEQSPDAVALLAPGRAPLTYGGLYQQVAAVVESLHARGIGRGDRVALVLPNGPEMAVAFLATAAAATCAPLNPAYRAGEFDFYLADLNARALIVPARTDSPATPVARSRGLPVIELSPLLEAEAGLFRLAGDAHPNPAPPDSVRPDDIALVLHTSGTTSRPKLVPLTHANLCASAHHIRATLELTGRDRCLNVMPLFHIHGLVGALLASLAAGASVCCTPGFSAPQFFTWMAEARPTWYTAVPTMHQAILARAASHGETIRQCPLRFVRSSSSALPPQVMAELEAVFQAPVIEAYGMTEASHQVTSNPLPSSAARERKLGSVGRAAGPEVAIMDEAGRFVGPGQTGEVVIRGANVTRGYEGNPAANESAFIRGWFWTGDQGYRDAEGYLFLSGRLKEIINRGGEKISPRELDEALLDHPAVAQAVAFAIPDARLGEEVGAAVVLRENAAATERELREFVARRLADHKVPRRVLFVAEIPKGPTGKLQRIGLAERLGLAQEDGATGRRGDGAKSQRHRHRTPLSGPPVPPSPRRPVALRIEPRTPVEVVLAEIWSQVLGLDEVSVEAGFLELGGDSVLATQLIARIRDTLQVEVSLLILFEEASTVAGMAAVLLHEPGERVRIERVAQLLIRLEALDEDTVDLLLSQ